MYNNSVFVKKKNNEKICYETILETVPRNCYKSSQADKKDQVEIRWRFFDIPHKEKIKNMVEISRLPPNQPREYLDKSGNWIKITINLIYDRYVVEEYYYYTNN